MINTEDTIGIKGILKLMEGKENRKCAFNECLTYHDLLYYCILINFKLFSQE